MGKLRVLDISLKRHMSSLQRQIESIIILKDNPELEWDLFVSNCVNTANARSGIIKTSKLLKQELKDTKQKYENWLIQRPNYIRPVRPASELLMLQLIHGVKYFPNEDSKPQITMAISNSNSNTLHITDTSKNFSLYNTPSSSSQKSQLSNRLQQNDNTFTDDFEKKTTHSNTNMTQGSVYMKNIPQNNENLIQSSKSSFVDRKRQISRVIVPMQISEKQNDPQEVLYTGFIPESKQQVKSSLFKGWEKPPNLPKKQKKCKEGQLPEGIIPFAPIRLLPSFSPGLPQRREQNTVGSSSLIKLKAQQMKAEAARQSTK